LLLGIEAAWHPVWSFPYSLLQCNSSAHRGTRPRLQPRPGSPQRTISRRQLFSCFLKNSIVRCHASFDAWAL
jgi:hypothetical protein